MESERPLIIDIPHFFVRKSHDRVLKFWLWESRQKIFCVESLHLKVERPTISVRDSNASIAMGFVVFCRRTPAQVEVDGK